MSFLLIDIKKLKKAEWNYKTDDPIKQEKLKQNINQNGQLENLIVREVKNDFEVVNGNHRLNAFKELDYKEIYCFNLGKISLKKAKLIALQTNETKFNADTLKLNEILKELQEDTSIEELIKTLPYEKDFLELLNEPENIESLTDFIDDEATPLIDNNLVGTMKPIDHENKDNIYFSIGRDINELIDEEDYNDLINAMETLKVMFNTTSYVKALIEAGKHE
jgi:hypothetical protein